jgi:DNA-binding transcriptional MerR regulator
MKTRDLPLEVNKGHHYNPFQRGVRETSFVGEDVPVESTLNSGFSGTTVCRVTGVTYRQLDYWARTDLVTPSISPAHGSGSKRRYSYSDLVEVKVIKSLLDAGVSLGRTRQAVDCLRNSLGVDLGSASLILSGAKTVLAHSNGEIVDLLRGGQGVFNVVPLAGVVAELDHTIRQDQLELSGGSRVIA